MALASTRLRGRAASPWRLRALTALALVGSFALAGCSRDDRGDAPADTEPNQPVEREAVVSPLTGVKLTGKPPRHPVLAVKIDNTDGSAPQLGLGASELVVEELVEGGMTRLAAFYYSKVPGNVGPVRSMRATDIGVVQPVRAVLVASGGAPPTVSRVAEAGIKTFTEGAPGYYRDSGRAAPYNLFTRLDELAATLRGGDPPAPYLPFGDREELPAGRPVTHVSVGFSAGSSSTFEYRGGAYTDTDSYAGAGDDFRPRTLLALRVEVGDAGYLDPAGNPVPETTFSGRGEAHVFHGGRTFVATWAKAGLGGELRLQHRGSPLRIPPGKVWIGLVPVEGGAVSSSR